MSPRFLQFAPPPPKVVRCTRCGQHASVVVSGVVLCGDCFLQYAERRAPALLRALIA
jgi:ribosomal protein S14